MSQSSSGSETLDAWRPSKGFWAVLVLVVIVLTIVVGWRLYLSHLANVHADRGERIQEYGQEFADVLDSYGPIAPTEVDVGEERQSDLHNDDNDPTRKWWYSGSAYFSVDPERSLLAPKDAYFKLCDYFVSKGWETGRGGIGSDSVVFYREDDLGFWRVEVVGPRDSYQGVVFNITSDYAGGGYA